MILGMVGYFYAPNPMSHFISSFTGSSGPNPMAADILGRIGIPPIETVDQMFHYTFAGSVTAGILIVVFGILLKKIPKKIVLKSVIDKPDEKETQVFSRSPDEKMQTNLRSIRILQERLAKDEITSSEFQNLKRFLE